MRMYFAVAEPGKKLSCLGIGSVVERSLFQLDLRVRRELFLDKEIRE